MRQWVRRVFGFGRRRLRSITPDQQFQARIVLRNRLHAQAPSAINPYGVPSVRLWETNICPAFGRVRLHSSFNQYSQTRTENEDHDLPASRRAILSILRVATTTVFHGDRFKWSAQFTVSIDKTNMLFTNSVQKIQGTQYLTPRTFTGDKGKRKKSVPLSR